MTQEKGSAHAILVGVLVVALLGTLGFIFYQNFLQKNDQKQAAATQPAQTETQPAEKTDGKKYVTIDTFGVKFDAPTDGTIIEWAESGSYDGIKTVGFMTSNLTEDKTSCNAKGMAAGGLEQSSKPLSDQVTGTTVKVLNDGKPIDGYYYRFDLPNGPTCTDDNSQGGYTEAQKIEKLAETIQSAN